jgi:hypothetical protein
MKPLRKRKVGRPTKRTERVLNRLQEALEKGLPRWAACALAKISYDAFNEWMNKDPEFKASVLEWEAASMEDMIEGVKRETKGNQYLLGRRFRDDYGDKLNIESKGEQKVTVEVVRDRANPKV